MAQISFIGIIDHASGKVCQHSDTAFAYRSRSGKTYTQRRDGDYDYNPTSGQLIQQESFKTQVTAVNTYISGLSMTALEKLQAHYENSDGKTYPTFRSFIWKHMDFDKNEVIVGGWKYAADGTVSLVG